MSKDLNKIHYNRHHIIARSKWGTNHYNNVVQKDIKKHRAWHACFKNDWPASQILEVLKRNEKAMNPMFTKAVLDILDLFQWNYYKPETHKDKTIYKSDTWNLYSYMYNK